MIRIKSRAVINNRKNNLDFKVTNFNQNEELQGDVLNIMIYNRIIIILKNDIIVGNLKSKFNCDFRARPSRLSRILTSICENSFLKLFHSFEWGEFNLS